MVIEKENVLRVSQKLLQTNNSIIINVNNKRLVGYSKQLVYQVM